MNRTPVFTPTFTEFWKDFNEEQALIKDFYASSSRLLLYLSRMDEAEKNEILEGLLKIGIEKHKGYKIAWSALKQCNAKIGFTELLIEEAEKNLHGKMSTYEDAAVLADIVLILARENPVLADKTIEKYLFEYPIESYWTQVSWAVLPYKPEWFYQAWRRYFLNEPEENWKGSKLLELFLHLPETIPILDSSIRNFSVVHADRFMNGIEELRGEG